MEGRFLYNDTGFSNQTDENAYASTTYLNLPKDLSLANRKNFAMTSRKGVPLVYHCKFTVLMPVQDDGDVHLTTVVGTAQKNWVTRNASVKLHYAREKMFKNAGIRKSERGRYDKTIRLGYNAASQTWEVPSFYAGPVQYTASGSEWDDTVIAIDDDQDLCPVLFGTVIDEGSAISATTFNIQNAYLNSRRKPELDDMLPAESSAAHSIIRSMFNVEDHVDDELSAIADTNQDLTPYDTDASAGTFTSEAYGGIVQLGLNSGATGATMFVDVPFGICRLIHAKQTGDNADGNMEGAVAVHVEVLGFSEMEG